ncbi:MAG: hypothetical protein NXI02_03160 [Rhodobacteraceae bacterium]|nr:hypothetical protein [Paracoccaceae bacterium]
MVPSEKPVVSVSRHHDEWLCPAAPCLKDLAERLFNELEANTSRPSQYRLDATKRRKVIVENLVANFALLATSEHPCARLIVSAKRDAKSRYDRDGFPKKAFMAILESMERQGYIRRYAGTAHGKRTTLEPSERLLEALSDVTNPRAVSRVHGAETIMLNMNVGPKKRKRWIDYADTPETCRMRKEMETINAALGNAEITLDGRSLGPIHLVRLFWTGSPDEEFFDKHGRLYWGPWQHLPKAKRHGLKINGQSIVELDFKSMFPRLCYHLAGMPQPDGDLYEGVAMSRDASKLAMNALLCRTGPMRRMPDELKAMLGPGWNGNRVSAALAHRHPEITQMFGTGCGLHLMYLESEIMVSALLKLVEQDIVALALHDGLFSGIGHEDACRSAMGDASEEVLGVRLPVGKKSIIQ